MATNFRTPYYYYATLGGVFFVGWDTLGAIQLGGRTLKISTWFFVISIGAGFLRSCLLGGRRPRRGRRRQGTTAPFVVIIFLAGVLLVRALLTDKPFASTVGLAALFGAGLLPFAAVYLNRGSLNEILRWYVYGYVFASAYAVYEFGARLVGLPTLTPYQSTFAGGLPRAAAFAYEPAYFAAGAAAALVLTFLTLPSTANRRLLVSALTLGMFCANARIIFLMLPAAGLFAYFTAKHQRRVAWTTRRRIRAALFTAGFLAVVATIAAPAVVANVGGRALSIFDPSEQASNSPRLAWYSDMWHIVVERPLVGIGPAMLRTELQARDIVSVNIYKNQDSVFVANNFALQALLDGGALVLILEVALGIATYGAVRRTKAPMAVTCFVAWASYVLIAGWTVSNFWTGQAWVILGLTLGFAGELSADPHDFASHERFGSRDRLVLSPTRSREQARSKYPS